MTQGVIMPRQRASPEQHKRAYDLFLEGSGPAAILRMLEDEFEEPVSARTVATWVKSFKELSPGTVSLDSPFEWHRLEEYGLPWEASAYLLEMWAFVQENEIYEARGFTIPPPTIRQVRWWWRVHLAVPELDMADVWVLAQRFAFRELAHEVLGQPSGMADLEAHLAYKPWEGWPDSTEKLERYHRAIEEGRIPPLRFYKAMIVGPQMDKAMVRSMLGSQMFVPGYPELLFSQTELAIKKLMEDKP